MASQCTTKGCPLTQYAYFVVRVKSLECCEKQLVVRLAFGSYVLVLTLSADAGEVGPVDGGGGGGGDGMSPLHPCTVRYCMASSK